MLKQEFDRHLFEDRFVKFMFFKPQFRQITSTVLLVSLAACSSSPWSLTSRTTKGADSTQPTVSHQGNQPISTNLVALLLVNKDNLSNEFRGEIYPLALLLNDRYLEMVHDVTPEIQNNIPHERILQLNDQRIVTNAINNFTVISNQQKLGEFQVARPVVSQFSCSSMITGQGSFLGETSLQTIFEQISLEQSDGFNGWIGDQQFDQTWRTAIAVSQAPALSQPPAVSEADLARYRQAALALGQAAITQVAQGQPILGEAVVESMQVVDLDQDGSPEIFSKIKQGSAANADSSQQPSPTGFAAVWFTEKEGKPQLLETTQAAVGLAETQPFPYDLLEIIDINGDGVNEVIVKRTGYESTSFEIYEYKNNQLNQVFKGAGYGC